MVAAPEQIAVLVAHLADNKLFLGRRYADWCCGAPTLEAAVAAAAMAQDEIGHARSFYPLLADLAGSSEQTVPETRTIFTNATVLDFPFENWTDFVAANFLLDTALTILVESAVASSLEPLGQRARRIVGEEAMHWLHARSWTRRLLAMDSGVKQALVTSLSTAYGPSQLIFAVAGQALVDSNVLDADESLLTARFERLIQPVLREADVSL